MVFVLLLLLAVTSGDPTCTDESDERCGAWNTQGQLYEYASVANPPMSQIPIKVFPPSLHQSGPTAVIPLDLSKDLELPYPATAPNLLAAFIRIAAAEKIVSSVKWATSQSFYVIRGRGSSRTRAGTVGWKAGDLYVLPYLGDDTPAVCDSGNQCVEHGCLEDSKFGRCAIYWVHDEPLLRYLGVRPEDTRRFEPALYPGDVMRSTVHNIPEMTADGVKRNRRGILLSNSATNQTKTLTPTLWSLLNSINGGAVQLPHKHNSVALDLAVSGGDRGLVYSLLGRELDKEGNIVEPVKAVWETGGVFVTPPGWWHSHHNTGQSVAWVLPIQDAGLYTHQRTLDIRFMQDEADRLKKGVSRGATQDEVAAPPARPLVAGTMMLGTFEGGERH